MVVTACGDCQGEGCKNTEELMIEEENYDTFA